MVPLLLLALALDGPERCTLSGTVVDSVTEKGLSKVELLLEPVGRWTHTAATTTGPEGRFTMVGVEPGAYRLTGRRSGYLETLYGKGSVLHLRPGAPSEVRHKMVPAGSISGTVRDADGEPLEGVRVVIARRTAEHGRPQVEGYDSATAGDAGVFRSSGLPPGTYYVAVAPRREQWDVVDHSPAAKGERLAAVMTFYPGVTDAAAATPIYLPAGARRNGIDLTLSRTRVFRVAGRVRNPPAERLHLTLEPDGPIAREHPLRTATRTAAGDFEFRDVPGGSYGLNGMPVTVAGDVDGITVEHSEGAEIRGRITYDGERPNGRVHLFITADGRRGHMPDLRPDLTFTARKVEPGRYDVQVGQSEPRRAYVKSVRSGERDVLAEGLPVAGGVVPLDIVLASDGARVEAVVTDREGRPILGATVVMVPPEALRERLDLYRHAVTDRFGKCSLDPAAPGEYQLFAWEEIEEGAWRDPEFLRGYEKRGEPVALAANERKSVRLRVLPMLP